ncbi:MAG: hypothetical protein Q8R18_01985 [bacterium]|nr:hypothetical protein [bacterium]
MQPLENIIKDEVFIIGRIRESTRDLQFFSRKGAEILVYKGNQKVLQIVRSINEKQKALIIRRWGYYPSNNLIFEILSQVEATTILKANFNPQITAQRYAKFVIYYE